MASDDLLNRTTQEIRDRLKELEPLVREHERLQAALKALEGAAAIKACRVGGGPVGVEGTAPRPLVAQDAVSVVNNSSTC